MTSEQVDEILLVKHDVRYCTFYMVDTQKVKREIFVFANLDKLDINTWEYIEEPDFKKYLKGDRGVIKTFHVKDILSLEICSD